MDGSLWIGTDGWVLAGPAPLLLLVPQAHPLPACMPLSLPPPPAAFTVVAALLMDRLGRRALLLTSFAGMAACLAALSAFMLLPSE